MSVIVRKHSKKYLKEQSDRFLVTKVKLALNYTFQTFIQIKYYAEWFEV